MNDVGTILREAREVKGYSFQDIEQVTRIRARYLEALENGTYQLLPTPAHVRGFLRNYAVALGLDPEALLQAYEEAQRSSGTRRKGRLANRSLPETSSAATIRPSPTAISPDLFVGILLTLGIIALLIWGLSRILPPSGGTNSTATPTVQVGGLLVATATPPFILVRAQPGGSASAITSPGTAPNGTPAPQLARVAAGPSTTRAESGVIEVSIQVIERSWLKVVVDGAVNFQGMAMPGWSQSWEGKQVVQVITGNAGGVVLAQNGLLVGPLGERNQVIDRSWGSQGEVRSQPVTPLPTSRIAAGGAP